MKLSYIVPIYNVEKYLRQCIDSILAQSFDDYEIILVDDASPDSCPQICDEYAKKFPDVVRVIHQRNMGLAGARNSGLNKASGDYVYFFDSDDFFIADGVERMYRIAVNHDADIIHSSYISYNEREKNKELMRSPIKTDLVLNHTDMQNIVCRNSTERTTIFVWRNIYKKDFLKKNNLYFDENLRMLEDSPFNTKAFLMAERFICIDNPIYAYRIREDSLQRKKYVADYDKILEYQWNLKLKYFKQHGNGSEIYYKDIADFTIRNMLPILLGNVYRNDIKGKYSILKRIGNSEMLRKSFRDYDINEFKSKSLDWWATYFMSKHIYLPAHLLCKRVLYK